MLTHLDDYLVHQTPEPVAHPDTGDRNFYDRFFFNGYARVGDLFFGAALGLYPNRRVMDAAFSVVRGGRQHALHASRLAPVERTETRVGPIAVDVLAPLDQLALRVAPNAHGLEADLVFRSRTVAIEEPRFTLRRNGRVFMDATRLTQFGTWEGWIAVDGARVAIAPGDVLGCRDRSWGVRPVGEPEGGAPGMAPQFFWLWAPLHFDDVCTHLQVNEDADGRRLAASGVLVRTDRRDETAIQTMAAVDHRVRWRAGTRRADAADLTLVPHSDAAHTIALEPLLTFQMLGLGYVNPEWGHGHWKGEEAVGGSAWTLADLDPLDPRHLHVQQLCRARMGGRVGLGVLEQLVIGPHAPSGFGDLFDGAREGATSC